MKNSVPRNVLEINQMLENLERKRMECLKLNMYAAALSIGSQIYMLEWAFNLRQDPEANKIPKEEEEIKKMKGWIKEAVKEAVRSEMKK